MSLLDGLIAHTLIESEKQSKHATLMQFYSLDKEIGIMQESLLDSFISSDMTSREYQSKQLPIVFLKAKAITLLKSLNL